MKTWKKWGIGLVIAAIVIASYAAFAGQFLKGSAVRAFGNGTLDNADYWSDQPSILSAGYGFDNIIGLPTIDEQTVHVQFVARALPNRVSRSSMG
jgi:hypothetical protein